MTRPKRKSVTRNDFIQRFRRCGLSYRKATDIYESMVDVVGTAVLSKQGVEFGKVGKISPVVANAKTVSMNFPNRQRQIMLGRRVKFKFKVHRAFMDKHVDDWF